MNKRAWITVLIPICLVLAGCSIKPLSGGTGEETTNGMVMGTVIDQTGAPAANVQVTLYPAYYDPVKDSALSASLSDTTDSSGFYHIIINDTGSYNIEAEHLIERTRVLITGITVKHDTLYVPTHTLKPTGCIKIMPPDNADALYGYLYVPGSNIFAFLNNTSGFVTLDSVPAGRIPAVYYATMRTPVQTPLTYDIQVPSEDTIIITYPSWKYSRRVYLNTSASGANVEGDVYGLPVLVRLTENTFDFSQAKANGEDIRFTKSGGSPLVYEIEQWDAAAKSAAIWVKVDTIYGNNGTQTIMMYWGNAVAADSSSSTAVFDTSAGFQGVWHLNEYGNEIALDATPNRFDGTAYNMSNASPISGAIGKARVFDGDSSYIIIPNTASGKLNFPEDGYFTVSAWVYLDSFDLVPYAIVAKGYEQYLLRFTYFPLNEPLWEFTDFSQTDNWRAVNYPATEKQWVFLTGVRNGSSQYLFCNGELVDSVTMKYPQGFSRDTSNNLSIGRFLEYVTFPTNDGYCFFKGRIDEVRICNVARNQHWVRACYMNQRSDDRLVQFK